MLQGVLERLEVVEGLLEESSLGICCVGLIIVIVIVVGVLRLVN